MSEFNFATASKSELKAYAQNNLDLNLPMTMGEGTMRDKILIRCQDLQIEPPKAVLTSTKGRAHQGKKIIVNIGKVKGDTAPVPVSVQGVQYTIPRGIDIAVPPAVVEVLRNAIQDIVTQDPETGEIQHEEVQTYPFSIKGEAA